MAAPGPGSDVDPPPEPDQGHRSASQPDPAPAHAPSALVTRREPILYVAGLVSPEIDSADLHHLQRVLRLRDGADICLCDGRGSWQPAQLRGDAAVPTGEVQQEAAAEPLLSVAVALPKGDRADWMVQKVTELGVDAIVVLNAERSVVRWRHPPPAPPRPARKAAPPDQGGRTWERFQRVIRSAGAQSRRAHLPRLDGPKDLNETIKWAEAGGVALAHPGGGPLTPDIRTVLIGPEGGWSPTELSAGLPTVGLGPHVLRVETAAMAATTLLVALRSQHVSFARSARENALGG